MDEVVFHVDTDQAERFFAYAGYRARHLREPLTRAGGALTDHILRTFESEGASVGEPWDELSKRQLRWRAKHGYPAHPILQVTHTLIRAAISNRAKRIEGDALHYHLEHPVYAAAHQYGGWVDEKGHEHPPARPFVVVTEELDAEIEYRFSEWIDEVHAVARHYSKRFGVPGTPHPFDA